MTSVLCCWLKMCGWSKSNQKHNKHTNFEYKLQLQLSGLSKQYISSFKAFGRGQIVFYLIFSHFSFLTWLNPAHFSRHPIKCVACIHANILGSFHIYGSLQLSPGVLPYISHNYKYVLPQRGWFLHCSGLKTGTDFSHFGLESAMRSSRELRECMNALFISIPNE